MFIQTADTPNPNVLKFMPGEILVAEGAYDFTSLEEAAISPLAQRLFHLDGVTGVFIGRDFVSVSKRDERNWDVLRPLILGALMDHLIEKHPVLITVASVGSEEAAASIYEEEPVNELDREIVSQIKELLDTRIRPAVAADGGDIVFVKFADGVVYLKLQGACAGCPSSSVTLKDGIENMLKHYVPEVIAVQSIDAEGV